VSAPVQPSWVIWLKDGRYTYGWGATAEEVKANYLKEWEEGIARIAPAAEHPNQLPPRQYVPIVSAGLRNRVLGGHV
jgi:hypothetical protein